MRGSHWAHVVHMVCMRKRSSSQGGAQVPFCAKNTCIVSFYMYSTVLLPFQDAGDTGHSTIENTSLASRSGRGPPPRVVLPSD